MLRRYVTLGLIFWCCACDTDKGPRSTDADFFSPRDASAADAAASPMTDGSTADAGTSVWSDAGRDAGAAGSASGDAQVALSLAVPLISATTTKLDAVPQIVSVPTTKIVFDVTLGLAVGEGYPTDLAVYLGTSFWAGCGQLQGAFRFTRIVGASSAITAMLTDDVNLQLRVASEGKAEVMVYGVYRPSADEACAESLAMQGDVPVEMRLSLSALRPSGVRWRRPGPCMDNGPLLVATSSTLDLHVELLDAAGESFIAFNAHPDRQISLTVESSAQLPQPPSTVEAGLAELRWPSLASRISIRPAIGEPLVVTTVAASAVTELEVEFALGGTAGGAITLRDGESAGDAGWHRVSNRLAPTVVKAKVGDNLLCSQPDQAWFELRSDTPSRCDTLVEMPLVLDRAVVLPRSSLGLSSRVLADGVCTLRLRAPGLDGGKGFEQRLSVTLSNVSSLSRNL
ncbi:MAG: hypothetical protein RLZZ450_4247 [Pseudomonadota bacterium]|jgi:hypothetical protein